MLKNQKYKHYDVLDDLLTIPKEEINRPILYGDDTKPMPPILIAIQNRRRDVLHELLQKQKQAKKTILATEFNPISFAYTLAREALKEGDIALFISHFKALVMVDDSHGTSIKLMHDLDHYLAHLPMKNFKPAIKEILEAIKNISEEDRLEILGQSKYIDYLNTAFLGNKTKAKMEFEKNELRVLNEVGFEHAKAKENGNKYTRYFIKQVLQPEEVFQKKGGYYQQVLFFQDLYIDNLDYAIKLINAKLGTELKVNLDGVCSAFTKYWLSNESLEKVGLENIQNLFFRKIMEIASFTQKEIRDKVNTDENFVKLIKDQATNLDTIHFNDQFEGQLSQRTMKKNFGLELIDEYNVSHLKLNEPKLAYLRIRYKDGSGHAIGVHLQEIEVTDEKGEDAHQTEILYKVWNSNDTPKTFTKSQFRDYLKNLGDDHTVKSLSIFEFSPFDEPATKEKVTAIDDFITSISELNYPPNSYERGILDCIKKLIMHHDNGVVPVNEVIPLFVLLASVINKNFDEEIDLTDLNHIVGKYHLIKLEDINLNNLTFVPELIESALTKDSPQPQIATALFSLGYSLQENYLTLKKEQQDMVLMQAIKEDRRNLLNAILKVRPNDPHNFPVSLVLKEVLKSSTNTNYKNILAHLLLTGKTLSDEDFQKLEKKQSSMFMFAKPNPTKEALKETILQQVLGLIENNENKTLGRKEKAIIAMLDYALNPAHQSDNGCYDILSTPTIQTTKDGVKIIHPQERITEALKESNITIKSSMQSKYPFLTKYLESLQPVSEYSLSD